MPRRKLRTLADRITHIRQQQDMTQAEFARMIGISRSAQNQLEVGQSNNMRVSTLISINKHTGFRIPWIVDGTGEQMDVLVPDEMVDAKVERLYRKLTRLPEEYQKKVESEVDFLLTLKSRSGQSPD